MNGNDPKDMIQSYSLVDMSKHYTGFHSTCILYSTWLCFFSYSSTLKDCFHWKNISCYLTYNWTFEILTTDAPVQLSLLTSLQEVTFLILRLQDALEGIKPLTAFGSFGNVKRGEAAQAPSRSKSMLSSFFVKTKAAKIRASSMSWTPLKTKCKGSTMRVSFSFG